MVGDLSFQHHKLIPQIIYIIIKRLLKLLALLLQVEVLLLDFKKLSELPLILILQPLVLVLHLFKLLLLTLHVMIKVLYLLLFLRY